MLVSQKPRKLKTKPHLFLKLKYLLIKNQGLLYDKKIFLVEVIFKAAFFSTQIFCKVETENIGLGFLGLPFLLISFSAVFEITF